MMMMMRMSPEKRKRKWNRVKCVRLRSNLKRTKVHSSIIWQIWNIKSSKKTFYTMCTRTRLHTKRLFSKVSQMNTDFIYMIDNCLCSLIKCILFQFTTKQLFLVTLETSISNSKRMDERCYNYSKHFEMRAKYYYWQYFIVSMRSKIDYIKQKCI